MAAICELRFFYWFTVGRPCDFPEKRLKIDNEPNIATDRNSAIEINTQECNYKHFWKNKNK